MFPPPGAFCYNGLCVPFVVSGIYLTCTMAITTLAMVATVFVLNLYGMKEKPVPMWARKIFVVYLARVLCMCNCASPQEHRRRDVEVRYNHSRRDKYTYKLVRTTDPSAPDAPLYDSNFYMTAKAHCSSDPQEPLMPCDSASSASPASSRPSAHASPMRTPRASSEEQSQSFPQYPAQSITDDHGRIALAQADYAKDWVHVAAVCDRLFFWLCFLFISITTLLLFHPLTTSRYFKIPIIEAGDK